MKEFMMLFHYDYRPDLMPSPEQMQASIKLWQDWIGGIAAQGKYVGTNALTFEGKTLQPNNVITDGPYAEVKEIIGGYLIVKADDMDNAMELAHGCPVLNMPGGKVEVRSFKVMDLSKFN